MRTISLLVAAVAFACAIPAMGDDEALAPGAGVILVRQAAHVSKLSLLQRAIELASLSASEKSGITATLDPFIQSQQMWIDDAAAHHANSEKDQKFAEDGMRASGPKIRQLIGELDAKKLGDGMKAASLEGSIFIESWPIGKQTDPLPELIKTTGVDEKTAKAIQQIRDDYAFHAKLSLVDDQSRAAIAAIDVQINPKFWDDETVGAGIRSAAKARELLSPAQLEKWNSLIQSLAAAKPD